MNFNEVKDPESVWNKVTKFEVETYINSASDRGSSEKETPEKEIINEIKQEMEQIAETEEINENN